jgi:hypothetical protein
LDGQSLNKLIAGRHTGDDRPSSVNFGYGLEKNNPKLALLDTSLVYGGLDATIL